MDFEKFEEFQRRLVEQERERLRAQQLGDMLGRQNINASSTADLTFRSLQQAYADLVAERERREPRGLSESIRPTARRNATEPLVTPAVAAYLEDWFSKEPAQ